MGAEGRLDGGGLGLVVELGGGAVGVDVADVVRRHVGVPQGPLHRQRGATPLIVGHDLVVGVVAGGEAGDLGG